MAALVLEAVFFFSLVGMDYKSSITRFVFQLNVGPSPILVLESVIFEVVYNNMAEAVAHAF